MTDDEREQFAEGWAEGLRLGASEVERAAREVARKAVEAALEAAREHSPGSGLGELLDYYDNHDTSAEMESGET